jgi:hypothetical protein
MILPESPMLPAGEWLPADKSEVQAGLALPTAMSRLPDEKDATTQTVIAVAESIPGLPYREAVAACCQIPTWRACSSDAEAMRIDRALVLASSKCSTPVQMQIAFRLEAREAETPGVDALELAIRLLRHENLTNPHGIQLDDFWYQQYTLFRPSTISKHKLSTEDMWRYAMQAKSPELAAAFIRSNPKLPSRTTLLAFLPKLKSYWLGTQRDLMYYFAEILREDKLNPKLIQDQETLVMDWKNYDESMTLLQQLFERQPD